MNNTIVFTLSISFCIPAYRYATFKRTFQSIVNLKDLNKIKYEIFISDDSPDDQIKEYLEKQKIPEIRYVRNKNKGSCNNHNNLVYNARYEWVVVLHDDDFLYQNFVTEFINNARNIDESDIVWGGRTVTNSKNKILKTYLVKNGTNMMFSGGEYLRILLGSNSKKLYLTAPLMVSGLAVHKSLIAKSHAIFDSDIGLGTDMLYIYKLLIYAKQIYYINSVLSDYYYNENSERTEASNEGMVFYKGRKIINMVLDELSRLESKEQFKSDRRAFLRRFYQNSMNINGPILWTSLRYKGAYIKRIKTQLAIFFDILANEKSLIFHPSTYLILIVSFFPQLILKWAHRLLLSKLI